MMPTRLPIAMLCVSMATACAPSIDTADGIVAGLRLDPPPPEMTETCATPPPLTRGTRAEVTKALAGAFAALRICRDRHGRLVAYYADRDAHLRGGAPLPLAKD